MSKKNLYQIQQIGDVHNFGKSTYLRSDGKIVKPRNTAWESAFLSSRSPLRRQIDTICRGAGLQVPLPDIFYSQAAEGGSAVDVVNLVPCTSYTLKDVESLGVVLAVAVWFGMQDLTSENVVIGRRDDGTLTVGPVDLESLLAPVKSLADTGLISHPGRFDQNTGLAPLREHLREMADSKAPAVLIGVFSSLLSLFLQNRHELSQLVQLLLCEPIRLKIRSTDFYRTVIAQGRAAADFSNLLDEESRQLLRGDVPYLFCLPNQEKIYWFDSPESIKPVNDTKSFDRLKTMPVWPLITSVEEVSDLTHRCVEELIAYFWKDKELNTSHSGIEILNDAKGMRIKSQGRYAPL